MKQQVSSTQEHRQKAKAKGAITIALVTVSDTRSVDTDKNGQYLKREIVKNKHTVCDYKIVSDEPDQIDQILEQFVIGSAKIIIFNGGTGITTRDRTFDVISRKLEKTLLGFGELFRILSYDQVGAAAMLSRACAGVYKNKVIISIPGSTQAVELACKKLIKPELQHLAWEITR